ncbi:MAG: cytochrome ubiquinol oxidase subunit I [bacterium]
MDAALLSRIQFGMTIGLHYLFPITTLGLAFFILLFESLALGTRREPYDRAAAFLTRILGLVFVGGVATGLLLPVEIGANWARFSRFAGPVFGPMLSLEAMLAFALESAFLAILLFARDKVSPGLRWFAALCVFTGSHLSAVLIVSANSWLQTPAGMVMENGHVVLTSLREAILNPSCILRVLHVLTATWLAGAFILCGVAAYYTARSRQQILASTLFAWALPIALLTALAQPLIGHFHIMNVSAHVPEKVAAYEGVFQTTAGAPLYLFGIPDEQNQTVHLPVRIPCGLSLLESGTRTSVVKGLNEFPENQWPPVNVVFTCFHLMVMLGVVMVGITGLGTWLLWRRKLARARWYLLLFPWLIVLPYLASEIGWCTAEIGRQPWMVHDLLRTSAATSANLPAWQVGTSLAGFVLLHLLIVSLTLFFACQIIRQGPGRPEEPHA